MMIGAAAAGKQSVSSYVYDGSRLEALYFMNARISALPAKQKKGITGDVSLLNGKSYRFDAAFSMIRGWTVLRARTARPFTKQASAITKTESAMTSFRISGFINCVPS